MRELLFIISFLQIQFCLFQDIGRLWYFGENAGLDFRSGTPVPLLNSGMFSIDGSSVITDKNDSLLFYTNGETIWNRLHKVMFNGDKLNGSIDCMHSSTVIKINKFNTILYYVFTCDKKGGPLGLQYSIVDMNKQGGLGEVIIKNVFVRNNLTEKVLAIPNANHCDSWLICHELGSALFFVYPVTGCGLGDPVISEVGSIQQFGMPLGEGAQGQIVASPDGKIIAMASYSNGEDQLFNFDNSSGIISSPITLGNSDRNWGIAFSPDGKKLYSTSWGYWGVYQFDLTNYNQAAILATETFVGAVTGPDLLYKAAAMQLGPDNKIYIAKWNSDYLAVIDKPNLLGFACKLIDNGVNIGNRSKAGLTYFSMFPFDTLFKKSIKLVTILGSDTSLCAPINYKLSSNNPCVVWFDNSMQKEIMITSNAQDW